MGIFPILMNIIQFWIIDSIVKAGRLSDAEETGPSGGADEEEARAPFLAHDRDEEERGETVETRVPPNSSKPSDTEESKVPPSEASSSNTH
jgi:hypothetical protein